MTIVATICNAWCEPPAVGEAVPDEWFVQRDVILMQLWNERYPVSARTVCELVMEDG